MEPLLLLTHRIPYPPIKGDKIRSYEILRYLSTRYRVHLGTFVDDPRDLSHVERVRSYCEDAFFARLNPHVAKLLSLRGLLLGSSLSAPYYHSRALQDWVRTTVERERISKAIVFSSPVAQHVPHDRGMRVIVDFVDVDSEKWSQFARARPWPFSWVYRREATKLLEFERSVAKRSHAAVFVTADEAALFSRRAPDIAGRVVAVGNGVDSAYFDPDVRHPRPFDGDETPIVFTGAMDYWPNVDAACWFAEQVLPAVQAGRPDVRFYIVGMNPAPAVRKLAADNAAIRVTGRVDDVRPYLQHARVVVAPMRISRGIQNKILEAMAMGRPVVASCDAGSAVRARPDEELLLADSSDEFTRKVLFALSEPDAIAIGRAGRSRVLQDYVWARRLERFSSLLETGDAGAIPCEIERSSVLAGQSPQ